MSPAITSRQLLNRSRGEQFQPNLFGICHKGQKRLLLKPITSFLISAGIFDARPSAVTSNENAPFRFGDFRQPCPLKFAINSHGQAPSARAGCELTITRKGTGGSEVILSARKVPPIARH